MADGIGRRNKACHASPVCNGIWRRMTAPGGGLAAVEIFNFRICLLADAVFRSSTDTTERKHPRPHAVIECCRRYTACARSISSKTATSNSYVCRSGPPSHAPHHEQATELPGRSAYSFLRVIATAYSVPGKTF